MSGWGSDLWDRGEVGLSKCSCNEDMTFAWMMISHDHIMMTWMMISHNCTYEDDLDDDLS